MKEDMSVYTGKQLDTAIIAKALSHPARIAILEYIIKNGGCCFTGINGCTSLAKSTTSRHISELVNAGLIMGDGNSTRPKYCINKATMTKARGLLSKVLNCDCDSNKVMEAQRGESNETQMLIKKHC